MLAIFCIVQKRKKLQIFEIINKNKKFYLKENCVRKKIRNLLFSLSIIILIIGIIVGISVSNELISYMTPKDNLTV